MPTHAEKRLLRYTPEQLFDLRDPAPFRERDLDEQRESNTARAEDRKSPDELTRQELQNRIRQELLKSSRLEYTPDFIRLIEAYYQKIENP